MRKFTWIYLKKKKKACFCRKQLAPSLSSPRPHPQPSQGTGASASARPRGKRCPMIASQRAEEASAGRKQGQRLHAAPRIRSRLQQLTGAP